MELGIKLWSRNSREHILNSQFADFIEVLPVNKRSVLKFSEQKKKYSVHAPHEGFGFDPLKDYAKSRKILRFAVNVAKRLKAEWVIMHTASMDHEPSEKDFREGVKKTAKLIKEAGSGRILVENTAIKTLFREQEGYNYFCYSPGQIKELLEESGAGFCLDFEHAAATAYELGKDYKEVVNGLAKLKPEYFQLSGTKPQFSERHTSILDWGVIELEFIRGIVKKLDKPLCLETPLDIEQRKREVELLKK